MRWISFLLFCPLLAEAVKIGRVSGPGDDDRFQREEFWSYSPNLATSFTLEPVTHRIQWWTTLDSVVAVCRLVENAAVRVLVTDGPPRLYPLMATYSNHMQMASVGGTVNLLPDTSEAAAFFIREWKSFAFIYTTETGRRLRLVACNRNLGDVFKTLHKGGNYPAIIFHPKGPDQLQKILRLLDFTPRVEAFWRTNGAKETLEFAKSLPNVPLLLASSESLAEELLENLALLRRSFDIILLTAVGNVRKKVHPGSYRLIQFSFVDQDSPALKGFENRWKTIRRTSTADKDLPDTAILNHEASQVLQSLFNEEILPDTSNQPSNCFNYSAGLSQNALKKVSVPDGLTGDIKFNSDGNRWGYKLHIYEEMPVDLKKIGSWTAEEGVQLMEKRNVQMSPSSAAYQSERSTPIRVTSIISKPFLFEGTSGNLEGYVVDLLEELKKVLQISFQIQVVKDGFYGINRTGSWNGMMGEVLRNEADIAVADLTKTRIREEVVDFSKAFMTMGLNVLLKKPEDIQHEKSSFSPFSFLTVWSAEMWTVVIIMVVLFSGACYLISRFIGPPDRVRALESKGTDNLSPCGSLWFTWASILLRDTGIYPRTFSHRVWACLWWTMCFFLALSYISNLSAFLLQTRRSITTTHSRKTSQQVIEDLLQKGKPEIGCIGWGSTYSFFKNSNIGIYERLGRYLERNPDVVSKSSKEAVRRVRESDGSYAFIMESPSSQYHSNIEPCDLFVSAGYLTTKSLAVAFPKKSPHKSMIDHGILSLTESGTLRKLYEKWWHNFSSTCEDPNMDILPKVYSKSLRLQEVSGVFYILIIIALVSIATAAVEKYTSAKKITFD